MSNLYELTAVYQRLQSEIENGEDVSGILEVIDDEIEKKAEGYVRVIRNNEGFITAIDGEIKRLTALKQNLKNGNDKLKNNLFDGMKATGKTKIETDFCKVSIQKNGGALPVIVDVPTEKLPDDLVQITEKPDLKAIAAYIEKTGDLAYAHFGERGESLRIK